MIVLSSLSVCYSAYFNIIKFALFIKHEISHNTEKNLIMFQRSLEKNTRVSSGYYIYKSEYSIPSERHNYPTVKFDNTVYYVNHCKVHYFISSLLNNFIRNFTKLFMQHYYESIHSIPSKSYTLSRHIVSWSYKSWRFLALMNISNFHPLVCFIPMNYHV